jgi:hypothetical protein
MEVVEGDAHGKERVLELVREAPRQLAPRRDALGLDESLAMIDELARHRLEGLGQRRDLAGGPHVIEAHVPVAARDGARRAGQLFDRSRHP